MKIVAEINGIVFVQTHLERGDVWAHIGQSSLPLAKQWHENGEQYVSFFNYTTGTDQRIFLMNEYEWQYAAEYVKA